MTVSPDPATAALERRLGRLLARGVVIPDPRQVFIAPDVDLDRIHPGAVLHPGTRLAGAAMLLGPGAMVGSEGPASLQDVAMDAGAEVASGYVAGAALLRGAKLGGNAHVRPATILEEDASTAHAVGLKQTVLMSFVTMGSLINFCDALLAGGTSRRDHTEVGSGVIHFNFTPWGASGDKATPTLVGDVYAGALLNRPRVFLGGTGGIAGPRRIGFGAFTPAGQVVRRDVGQHRMMAEATRSVDVAFDPAAGRYAEAKDAANREFIANLVALREWYAQVRLPPLSQAGATRAVVMHAVTLIDAMIAERRTRLAGYLKAFGRPEPHFAFTRPPCPAAAIRSGPDDGHVAWVRALDEAQVASCEAWLAAVGRSAWETSTTDVFNLNG